QQQGKGGAVVRAIGYAGFDFQPPAVADGVFHGRQLGREVRSNLASQSLSWMRLIVVMQGPARAHPPSSVLPHANGASQQEHLFVHMDRGTRDLGNPYHDAGPGNEAWLRDEHAGVGEMASY